MKPSFDELLRRLFMNKDELIALNNYLWDDDKEALRRMMLIIIDNGKTHRKMKELYPNEYRRTFKGTLRFDYGKQMYVVEHEDDD